MLLISKVPINFSQNPGASEETKTQESDILAQGRITATNRPPGSRYSVKLSLVICDWVLIHL